MKIETKRLTIRSLKTDDESSFIEMLFFYHLNKMKQDKIQKQFDEDEENQ